MFDIHRYYDLIREENILISYKGVFDGDIVGNIIKIVEKKLVISKEPVRVRKKIINILVESLQNILHYFNEESIEDNFTDQSFVVILKQASSYTIYTGNYLSIQRAKSLKKRIDNVNMMSEEDLKSLYISVLETPKVNMGGGAGLGLVDMVRRSSQKIAYDFKKYDAHYMLFTMQLIVSTTK
ncbi:MAG: SiaB family protein kinase [Thermonemataceae bacterium]